MPELLCPVLVGRDQELGVLRSALDRVATGHGATLVVLGEAGVGKFAGSGRPPRMPVAEESPC